MRRLNRPVVMAIIAVFSFISASISMASQENQYIDHVEIDLSDQVSLQNGAKLFVNYCLSCHSASFMRYNRMAKDLGFDEDLVKTEMMFAADKIGDLMTTTMPVEDAKKWFGTAPPDLSLTARLRGPDWVYSYLRRFYLDLKSPNGWNNLVFENVAMPHALYELQGRQRATFKLKSDKDGKKHKVFDKFEMVTAGKLTTAEYDTAMRDLTQFMVYLGEPAKLVRKKIGIWVMPFLLLFALLAFFLKKEYWRDVH